jgi:hypothetical protein
MRFSDWLLKEEAPQVTTVKGTPDNFYLVFNNGQQSGKVNNIVAVPGNPGMYQIKSQDQMNPYSVSMSPQIGQKLISFSWKQQPKPNMQKILAWPTPTIPQPPPYWTPEMMEMNHDNAGKYISNKLLQQGMEAKKAGIIGNKISEFIFYYSPYPPRVKNRVLMNLGNKYPDADTMELIKVADEHAKQAEPYFRMLKAKGYVSALQSPKPVV